MQDLFQDLCIRISAGPFVKDSLPDYTFKRNFTCIPRSGRAPSRRGLHLEIRNRNFTCIPCDGHTRSPQKVALSKSENPTLPFRAMDTHDLRRRLHLSEIATLPACRAMDTHDLRRGLHFEIRNRNFTCIPCDRHARSPQRAALRNQKTQLYLHVARWTPMISAEGCTSKSEIATSPAFRAIDTHDLRKGLRFEIGKRNFICIPRARHARSLQKVHISKTCFRSTVPATKS